MQTTTIGPIARRDGPHDCVIEALHGCCFMRSGPATYYGIANRPITVNGQIPIAANAVFCMPTALLTIEAAEPVDIALITMRGYAGQAVYGVPLEAAGRLRYIDGCTDSVLIYPPKKGDPCVNHLHFPPGIDQSFHTHPSLRMGLVYAGQGVASLDDREIALVPGTVFCIDAGERHRFRTGDTTMSIIAFHPDSDCGPTDEDHPMINRTVLPRKDNVLLQLIAGMGVPFAK